VRVYRFFGFFPTLGWPARWCGIFAREEEAAMAKMRTVQVARAGGALELIEREMPESARAEVRVRVERIPGHEIAGVNVIAICGFGPLTRTVKIEWLRS
jgi:hypothetical protein